MFLIKGVAPLYKTNSNKEEEGRRWPYGERSYNSLFQTAKKVQGLNQGPVEDQYPVNIYPEEPIKFKNSIHKEHRIIIHYS